MDSRIVPIRRNPHPSRVIGLGRVAGTVGIVNWASELISYLNGEAMSLVMTNEK